MIEHRFPATGPLRLEVTVPAADIEISSSDEGESLVTLTGSAKAVDATAVELVGNRLVIELRRKPLGGFIGRFDGPARLQARVPHGSSVEVSFASGQVALAGSFAGLSVRSAAGEVRASGELSGDATVQTVSGDVRLARVGGDLHVRTVSGSVAADAVDGSVSARSVSGDVRIRSLRDGTVSVQSVSGDVELGVARGTSVDVDAGSSSGRLRTELELSESPHGEPGPTLVVRSKTVSGDFRLFRAA